MNKEVMQEYLVAINNKWYNNLISDDYYEFLIDKLDAWYERSLK